MTGRSLHNDSGPALDADGLQVERAMFLRRGFTATGRVRLLGAHVGEQLDCTEAAFLNDFGPALQADGLRVGQDMYLREGFTATAAGPSARSACQSPHRRQPRM